MRTLLIFLSLLSFAGCDLLDPSSVILTNDTGKDSVLDTLFSSSQILPPSDINYYPEEDGAGFAVTVYWADSPTAVGYNVYVAASENGTYYKVNGDPLVEPVYRLPAYTFTEDAGEIRQYVKISSVSGSGKESPLSPCVETLISNESEFTIRVSDDISYVDTGDRTTCELEPQKSGGGGSSSGSSGRCLSCGGSGDCDACGGSGKVREWLPGTREYVEVECTECYRSGQCRDCNGTGDA